MTDEASQEPETTEVEVTDSAVEESAAEAVETETDPEAEATAEVVEEVQQETVQPTEAEAPTEETAEETTEAVAEEAPTEETVKEAAETVAEEAPTEETVKEATEAVAEEAPTEETVKEATEAVSEEAPETAEEAPVEETVEPTTRPGMEWYVLRVQSNKEDSVKEGLEKRIKAAALDDQIARVLVPTEKVSEIKSGKKRVSERKIYPGYVMVEMTFNDDTWYLVRETPGIGDFVGGRPNSKPIPMPKHEVDKLLGEATRTEEEQPKLKIAFREGEAVKITEGPFENFNGVVQEVIASKGLVKVEVTIFGRPTPVELEYWQVESI